MPIYDRVNAFGKDHRNQSLWAQREIYLSGSLKELKNQSRPFRNSKISKWGCSCLALTFFSLPSPCNSDSTTDWAIESETVRCTMWGGPPTTFSCKFGSLAVSAGESSPTLPVEALKFLILCCCNSAGQFSLNMLETERPLQLPSDQNWFINLFLLPLIPVQPCMYHASLPWDTSQYVLSIFKIIVLYLFLYIKIKSLACCN